MSKVYIKFMSYEEIQNTINQGYKPMSDLEYILEKHSNIINNGTEVYICECDKIIDLAGSIFYEEHIDLPYIINTSDILSYTPKPLKLIKRTRKQIREEKEFEEYREILRLVMSSVGKRQI